MTPTLPATHRARNRDLSRHIAPRLRIASGSVATLFLRMPFPPLRDQIVIVTGASSGIGEAIARRLAACGARLVLAARRLDRLKTLAAELDASGTRVEIVGCDVTSAEDRAQLVATALARFGRIDALVNNAGYGQRGPVERVSIDSIRNNFETNVFSLVALTQLVLPHLRAQGHGRIVNIGSVAGRIVRPMSSVYDSTKHALEGINDGLRGELKPFNIDVVLVRPGFIRTEFGQVANAVSASALGDAGPYAPYVEGFRANSQKLRSTAGRPDDIARAVEKALASAYPKTHYNAPRHATFFLFLRWLLPVRAMDYFVRLRKG